MDSMPRAPQPADYAPSGEPGSTGSRLKSVEEGSPAFRAGLRAGMQLEEVDGEPLHDLIDWYWLSDGSSITVSGTVPSDVAEDLGEDLPFEFECDISREVGQAWGIEFEECIFDHMHTCVNDCCFCFMKMLPQDMRETLYLRDDDYRLSFLQGNFVTLTNVDEPSLERIIAQCISPLHVSVHAVDHAVRRKIIGANEARGMDVLERFLAAGLQCHTQIVLVPGMNDGDILLDTLSWLEANSGVLSCSVVPLGYTRFQARFNHSYDDPSAAQNVIELVRPFQLRARAKNGATRFYLADEFYLDAGEPIPTAHTYDGYGQYEDGIGMVRSFIDDWEDYWAGEDGRTSELRLHALAEKQRHRVSFVTGTAFAKILSECLRSSPLFGKVGVTAVENDFFGGNVNVTGLLCGCGMVAAIHSLPHETCAFVPRVVFNADGMTLDDYSATRITEESGHEIRVVSCNARLMMNEVIAYLEQAD